MSVMEEQRARTRRSFTAGKGWPRRGPFNTTKVRSVPASGPLLVQVGGQGREEPLRDRRDPLVATLAVGDEDALLAGVDVAEAEAEDLAASQPTQQHRLNHGPVTPHSQRRHQSVDLAGVEDLRQRLR